MKIPFITSKTVIGQTHIVKTLNAEIEAANWHIANEKPFNFRPKYLGGPAGTGKGTIVEAFFKSCFPLEQYEVFPPNGGIGDFKDLMGKIVSERDGLCSAIPATVFYDEFHEANATVGEIVKLLINKHVGTVTRTGRTYHHDQNILSHRIFFASNEVIDKAIQSRCDILETSYYSRAEIEKHIKTFLQNGIDEQALEYCVDRLKPIGRQVQAAVEKLDQQPTNKIKLENAQAVIRDIFGLNPGGIERKDMKILKRLCEGAATIDVLKWSAGDQLKKQTKERCDWLQHLAFIEPTKHQGFALTKMGVKYYDGVITAIKEQKAKKAAKK